MRMPLLDPTPQSAEFQKELYHRFRYRIKTAFPVKNGTAMIPEGTTKIPKRAYYRCLELHEVVIPNSVTSIEEDAFKRCFSLKSITIPDSVTRIGNQAFYSCTALETVTLPNSIIEIGEYVFTNCTSLKKIFLPAGQAEFYKKYISKKLHDKINEISDINQH